MAQPAGKILIVDDDDDILLTARIVLKKHFQVKTANDPHQIADLLERESFDVVLLDMNFTAGFTSGKEGLRWLKKIRKQSPNTRVVLMTAYGEVQLAVKAMKEGATDFVVKPWENERLETAVQNAYQRTHGAGSVSASPDSPEFSSTREQGFAGIIGESPSMKAVYQTIEKVAATDANVLILGENGTGKELVARALHSRSLRADAPFVHVDLGAVPESLFEAELFGHVKGAFTDARENREGRFETANRGTLFLDEIGNLSLPMQAKLLSALQSRRITRVGSNRPLDIDIRLICATNMPLHQMVKENRFRQDLIYRINTVEVSLPLLRERGKDIQLLARHFLKTYTAKYQRQGLQLSTDALSRLQQYDWPGNVRELQHTLERAVIMAEGNEIQAGDLSISAHRASADQAFSEQELNLEEVEKKAIQKAIQKHQGNLSQAAKELGLGRTTLYRKMNKYGL
jgi:two-component system response regulator HydG